MLNILYLLNHRYPTEKAYGIQVSKMCEAFSRLGVNTTLLVPKRRSKIKDNPFSFYDLNNSFRIEILNSPDFYWPGFFDRFAFMIKNTLSAWKLIKFARKYFPNAFIFSRDEFPLFLLSFTNSKLCFEAHKFSENKMFLYKRLRRRGVKIIAISEGIKNMFLKLGYKDQDILIARDGADLKKFDINSSKLEARNNLGINKESKLVLYTGHLYPWKGVSIFLEASKSLPDVNFKTVTNQPYRLIPMYLKAADVLVLPNRSNEKLSRLYTSPLKMFEYMASGRPIVASDLPSIREVLSENNSVLVKPDDPKALALGIKSVLEDKDLAKKISTQAFLDVQQYDWVQRARNIINFVS